MDQTGVKLDTGNQTIFSPMYTIALLGPNNYQKKFTTYLPGKILQSPSKLDIIKSISKLQASF